MHKHSQPNGVHHVRTTAAAESMGRKSGPPLGGFLASAASGTLGLGEQGSAYLRVDSRGAARRAGGWTTCAAFLCRQWQGIRNRRLWRRRPGRSGACLEPKRVYSAPMPKPSTLWVRPPELAILLIFRPRGLGAARRATARAGRRSWGPVFPPVSDLFSEIASAGHSARLRAGPCAPARVRNGVEAVPPLGGTGGFGRIRPPRHAFGGPGPTPARW